MDILAAIGVFGGIAGPLAAYIAAIYKKRISELEAELQRVQIREKRMIGVILRGTEDDKQLIAELGRVLTEGDYQGGYRGTP